MKMQYKELDEDTCFEEHSKNKRNLFQEDSETQKIECSVDPKNLQTVLFILKLNVSCLSRQLEEVTIINKHLNQELETKSQQLASANIKLSMLRTQLQQKENLLKELNDKHKRLEEEVGNLDLGELKIKILNLKSLEELSNKTAEENFFQNVSDESRNEIKRLNEIVNTLQVSNCYNKQSLETEVERRTLIESEFKKVENVLDTLAATNVKLLYERDWNKARRKALIYKQEELLRKNASLQEYSDTLRGKYEALLLQKKKKKRRKENETPELQKKIKSKEFLCPNECEKINSQVHDTKANSGNGKKQEISELDMGIYRIKEILVKNYNEEREKATKLEQKLESMIVEISILQEEKENFENRLRTSEENYSKLKTNFDDLAVAHKNLVDFKKKEQMKINERIMGLNERLDFLGKRFVKRYQDERLPIMNAVILQKDSDHERSTNKTEEIDKEGSSI